MSATEDGLNRIYISQRLEDKLMQMCKHPLSMMIAPIGYGKSTATGWFLNRMQKDGGDTATQMIYTNSLDSFWKGFAQALCASQPFFEPIAHMPFPADPNSRQALAELFAQAPLEKPFYMLIEDFHLLESCEVFELFLFLLPACHENFHLIISGRNDFLTQGQRMRLGSRFLEIDASVLRLTHAEMQDYCKQCGVELEENQAQTLFAACEGWISALYLNLRAYVETGYMHLDVESIYTIIDEVLLSPLSARHRRFLTLMGITDAFTLEQAEFMWEEGDAQALLDQLTRSNAFISYLPDDGAYRYHHMLKTCVESLFNALHQEEKKAYYHRLGQWHQHAKHCGEAMRCYYLSGDFDSLLDIAVPGSYVLTVEYKDDVLTWLAECPKEKLLAHLPAVLVYMLHMFVAQNIPKLFELHRFLQDALAVDCTLSIQERNNLLGECEILMSLVKFNDVSAMWAHHKKAFGLLTRPTYSIKKYDAWTLGSPSVIMMFHRDVGALDDTVAMFQTAMFHYCFMTDGHGRGAQHVIQGELHYIRGSFIKASVSLEKARQEALAHDQWWIMMAADFLHMRLLAVGGRLQEGLALVQKQRENLKQRWHYLMLNTLDVCEAWLYALWGQPEAVAPWLLEGRLEDSWLYAPSLPMVHTAYNQVLLAQGRFAELAAREDHCTRLNHQHHYTLCSIHLHIQLAGAYEGLGDEEQATNQLIAGLKLAMPDGLVMPFVGNYRHIKNTLKVIAAGSTDCAEYVQCLLTLHARIRRGKHYTKEQPCYDSLDWGLSARELEVARMAAERKSNKEIAGILYLTEGTVKYYLNQVFSKLSLTGDAKNKRRLLERFFEGEAGE